MTEDAEYYLEMSRDDEASSRYGAESNCPYACMADLQIILTFQIILARKQLTWIPDDVLDNTFTRVFFFSTEIN